MRILFITLTVLLNTLKIGTYVTYITEKKEIHREKEEAVVVNFY